jgi:hypothetical protein
MQLNCSYNNNMNTKIEIVDNLTNQSKLKSIELVYCLQASYDPRTELPEWSLIVKPNFGNLVKLTRVGKHEINADEYDVIVAEYTKSMGGNQTFWLGHWNDGVLN